jgi:hypothetical protein
VKSTKASFPALPRSAFSSNLSNISWKVSSMYRPCEVISTIMWKSSTHL